MCEPSHSIIQYPDNPSLPDDSNLPMSDLSMRDRLNVGLGEKIASLGERIKSWFHFSKLGAGHSLAIELQGKKSLILPTETRYEGHWWDRKVVLDGPYHGYKSEQQEALQVATQYDLNKVIGNMSLFRRFLEQSLKNTQYGVYMYLDRLTERVLSKGGKDELALKLRRLGIVKLEIAPTQILIPTLMGVLRKRDNFQDHWSDVKTLWNK